ncbi:hypothetical protein SAMN05519104_7564 [Rhizobiales bacterium GAS188]|nr:hypothetical protein SAMN05519104_7564 [Rhizobiales bacterium GAS188]
MVDSGRSTVRDARLPIRATAVHRVHKRPVIVRRSGAIDVAGYWPSLRVARWGAGEQVRAAIAWQPSVEPLWGEEDRLASVTIIVQERIVSLLSRLVPAIPATAGDYVVRSWRTCFSRSASVCKKIERGEPIRHNTFRCCRCREQALVHAPLLVASKARVSARHLVGKRYATFSLKLAKVRCHAVFAAASL